MKKYVFLFLFLFVFKGASAQNTAKPWAYWWWLGSAVNEKDIHESLVKYADAGFGGLHIIPIYGIKGEESKFIEYLSPRWLQILDYTVKDAKALGLGIDMSLGTGWPYGGPNVSEEHAAKQLKFEKDSDGNLQPKVSLTKQMVKRAAPGGEGLVVDHFSKPGVSAYFERFDKVFDLKNYGVRAFYNDSYEVYGANWTNDFYSEFKKYRGYDFEPFVNILSKKDNFTISERRIKADYLETLSDLLLNNFTKLYTSFAHKYQKLNRNESHGSPANILDLYAASDIPESEFFGSKPYDIPGYRQDPDYEESRFGKPNIAVLKLASSPAHIFNKKLVSSETATWLGNHFKVSLSQIKPIIDESFLGGINHVFFHGVPYTPPAEVFPGWLFYASTNFNFNSHFWGQLPLLNAYIARAQEELQNSQADNDVLLYFPIHDLWHTPDAAIHMIDVHNIEKSGVFTPSFRGVIDKLQSNGVMYDFVSDRQLEYISKANVNRYKALVLPPMEFMPLATLRIIEKLQRKGMKVIFSDKKPTLASGFKDFENNQKVFEKCLTRFSTSTNLIKDLEAADVRIEELSALGLTFIRKIKNDESIYFISNLKNEFKKGTVSLKGTAKSVEVFDALANTRKYVSFTQSAGKVSFDLDLVPGKSTFVVLGNKELIQPAKVESQELQQTVLLSNNWSLEFVSGAPFMPTEKKNIILGSWTELPDSTVQYFSGVGKYSSTFEVPTDAQNKNVKLLLGDVRESAKVVINGVEIGTAWSLPFELDIPQGILKQQNNIEIYVQNLSINRVRYLDKNKVNWQKFYDINMVDINYKPFDSSNWKPVLSGLLGPVSLQY
jgi:hypothetical protein